MISNGQPHHAASTRLVHASRGLPEASAHLSHAALGELLTAYRYSLQVGRDVWDFAVTVRALSASGLTESDLRWLVCEEIVQHACEVTRVGDQSRQFQPTHPLVFTAQNCFVLTERGCEFARFLLDPHSIPETVESAPPPSVAQDVARSSGATQNGSCDPNPRPHWECDRHELRLSGLLIKQYKWPAANQEMVLAAFQEEGWPFRIDDPLPPQPDQDSKRRLSDTIKCLNRKQANPLLHFRGDGTGEGVIWEVRRGDNSTAG